ncbi:MAG: response regulator transcription factor [Gammaproteobacteria bacterium]|nr:response regulator transcription factor [Gammaproteobacteria bacterium]
MKNSIRIVIVDDHPMFREGVALTLNNDPSIEVIAEGQNSDDAIRLAEDHLPDVMLLDISMPGGGIESAEAISLSCPVVKIGMLTVSEREDDVMKSLSAGANGYILKGVGGKELIDIVKRLANGESYITPQLAARMLTEIRPGQTKEPQPRDIFSTLTAREEQILESVSRGLSNKEIGRELNITEKTVKHYVTNVLQKLQVRNRVEAALLAQKRSLE